MFFARIKMRQSLEIAQLLSIKSLYSPVSIINPHPHLPQGRVRAQPHQRLPAAPREWSGQHPTWDIQENLQPSSKSAAASGLRFQASLLQFHQWCHLKKKQYFPPTPSFLMLRVGKIACCRIFETNMRLRPRHLMSGVPQTTLRINDSLEELRELKQATIHIVVVYYSERIHVTISKGLRLCAPNARDPSLISGQGTRSHMPQLKIPCAATETQCSQINK